MIEMNEQGRVPIKLWTDGVPVEHEALNQVRNVASLPIVGPHIALMPDVHFGIGATVGSVIPTNRAIIPAAVGVDIGCGMMAIQTVLEADDWIPRRDEILDLLDKAVPVGGPGIKGSWKEPRFWDKMPRGIRANYKRGLEDGLEKILAKHPKVRPEPSVEQLGTLGGGNHFIEVCHDTDGKVWLMLHSGSRGVGNRIGTYFIERAKQQALKLDRTVKVDSNLAWLEDGTQDFEDYREALMWAQRYARMNRDMMMDIVLVEFEKLIGGPVYNASTAHVVNCHHNYVEEPRDGFFITRKGAVSAKRGELGIIPGSMGARSYIVRGLGNPESFESCSHGAGRVMSRRKAKENISLERHVEATEGVACRKDAGVLDESVDAYKNIDAVMEAQTDLVEVVAQLKQFVCVKG